MDNFVRLSIDSLAETMAANIERARRAGRSEDEIREMFLAGADSFRAMWDGKMTDDYLDGRLWRSGSTRYSECFAPRV
jgi:hypothetical protein